MTCNLMWVSGEGAAGKTAASQPGWREGSFPRSDKPRGHDAPALSAWLGLAGARRTSARPAPPGARPRAPRGFLQPRAGAGPARRVSALAARHSPPIELLKIMHRQQRE